MATPDAQTRKRAPIGSPDYYNWIAAVLFLAFVVCSAFLLFLNTNNVLTCLESWFGRRKAFVLQLFFWAALGATITSYRFFAEDKKINELEDLKESPDPQKLMWPNSQDVALYILRIIMSGAMGIIGSAILLAGLGVFGDGMQQEWGIRQKTGLIVFCFVVGMFQDDFLEFLSGFKKQFFRSTAKKDGAEPPKPNEPGENAN